MIEPEEEPEPEYIDINLIMPTDFITNFNSINNSTIQFINNGGYYDTYFDLWGVSLNYWL